MSGMCGIDLFEPYALSGRVAWGDVNPGLKPWAESSCPFGTKYPAPSPPVPSDTKYPAPSPRVALEKSSRRRILLRSMKNEREQPTCLGRPFDGAVQFRN